jgi:hypothetical protein
MTIRVKCPSCQQTLKAEERHAGRTVRCPACRAPVTIPAIEVDSAEETLDPFADVAEAPVVPQREQESPKPAKPKKKVTPKAEEPTEAVAGPSISEDDVGEWLSEGAAPPTVPTDEVVELPPQSPNWDGTSSTYDIAEIGPDEPLPPKKRRKKT